MMISIHSECLLYDLRSVLSAVRHHNDFLYTTPELRRAQSTVENLVEKIENAEAFIQELQKALLPQEEAGLGAHHSELDDPR